MSLIEQSKEILHEETYENETVFDLRLERLQKLGYFLFLGVNSTQANNLDFLIQNSIDSLQNFNHTVVKITSPTRCAIFGRDKDSKLPSAEEDFDNPAGADNIELIAISTLTPPTEAEKTANLIHRLLQKKN